MIMFNTIIIEKTAHGRYRLIGKAGRIKVSLGVFKYHDSAAEVGSAIIAGDNSTPKFYDLRGVK